MCGVPHHAVEGYIGKLLRAGLKVAICDQVEDPAQAKGLVRREVTRVVTPGTVSEPALLEGNEETLLAALVWEGERGAGAFLDVSTGGFFVRRWRTPEEGARGPAALAAARGALRERRPAGGARRRGSRARLPVRDAAAGRAPARGARGAADLLRRQFGAATLRGFGLDGDEPAVRAAAAALAYAQETQRSALAHVRGLALREPDDALLLDATTLANLEVFAPRATAAPRRAAGGARPHGQRRPAAACCATGCGGRCATRRRSRARHDAVGELLGDTARRERLRAASGADRRPRAAAAAAPCSARSSRARRRRCATACARRRACARSWRGRRRRSSPSWPPPTRWPTSPPSSAGCSAWRRPPRSRTAA